MDIQQIKKNANDEGCINIYKSYHFDIFEKLHTFTNIEHKRVAVLGCSTGLDCQLFVLAGAEKVLGVDLDPRIGKDFEAPNVSYLRESISALDSIENDSFDVIYSTAVFEHVFDIPGALNECQRILKPGGIAFILSSPLWNSPFGHHYKNMLENYPWMHLVLGQAEAVDFLTRNNIVEYNGIPTEEVLNYIYHPQHFNRFPASLYEYAATNIDGVEIIANKSSQQILSNFENLEFFEKAINRGYSDYELLTSMHLLVIKKYKRK